MTEIRLEECDACEGDGAHRVHVPHFYDPYYMHRTNRPCEACGGKGKVEIEVEPIEMEDLA